MVQRPYLLSMFVKRRVNLEIYVRLCSTFGNTRRNTPLDQLTVNPNAPITLSSYTSLCHLLTACQKKGLRYPYERQLLVLPSAAANHNQALNFVKNYARLWWQIFQPLLNMTTYKKIVGLSVTLNGLQKINSQTNGELINELGWEPIVDVTMVALELSNLRYVMPRQYYRILQSLHEIYHVEKKKVGRCVIDRELFWLFLPLTLETILSSYHNMENFESRLARNGLLHKIGNILIILHSMDMPKLKSYDALLRLSFLCYQSIANRRLVDVGVAAMMTRLNNFAQVFVAWNFDPSLFIADFWPQYFRVFNEYYRQLDEEGAGGSFCWFCFYNCHLVALHFGRFRDFKDIAYGLTVNRAGTVGPHSTRTQAEALLNLAEEKSADKYIIQRFRDILAGEHIVT